MSEVLHGPGSIKRIIQHERPKSVVLVTGDRSYEMSGAKSLVEPLIKAWREK